MNLMNAEKHYNTLNNYYLSKYGKKVYKIPLDGAFICPNIDGLVGIGGCTYCNHASTHSHDPKSLRAQWGEGIKTLEKKWGKGLYIPYFQFGSNTYGNLDKIKTLFEEALSLDSNIVMLSVSTRPDCLTSNILDYLEALNKRIPLQIELGLQSVHEKTAKMINRCHDLKCFDEAVLNLNNRGIEVVAHIINGLPYETDEMMLNTIKHLNTLPINGIKIHMLHILKNTKMADYYEDEPWHLLTLEAYVKITVKQICHLRSDIIIHRLTGDGKKEELIAPNWTLKKFVITNEIDKLMRKNNLYQGVYEKSDY